MSNESKVFLSLGGNVGDVQQSFFDAINLLSLHQAINLKASSSLLETKAWGLEEQPNFLNLGLVLTTSLQPFALLEELLKIEQQLGRIRHNKWGPRIIDIDILFWEHLAIHTATLTIPHKYLLERDFALASMAELAPNLSYQGKSFAQWYKLVGSNNIIKTLPAFELQLVSRCLYANQYPST